MEEESNTPTSWDALADSDLLAQWGQGKEDAAGALVRRYEGPLWGFLWRATGNRDRTRDLFQEVWMRFFDAVARGRFEDRGKGIKPFIFTIAKNLSNTPPPKQGKTGQTLDQIPSPQGNPETSSVSEETRREIALAIENLPEDQRHAVFLRFYEGAEYKEIAEIMGKSLGMAHNLVRQGIERIGREIGRGQRQ